MHSDEDLQTASGDVLFVIRDRLQAGSEPVRWGVAGKGRSMEAIPAHFLMLGNRSCCEISPSGGGAQCRGFAVLRRRRLPALCGKVRLLAKGEHDVVSQELTTHPTTQPAMLAACSPVGRVSLFCPSSGTTLEICKHCIT